MIAMMAILVPSYFIVIWISPGLELDLDYQSRSSFKSLAILYTLALFVVTAVVAAILFAIGTSLKKAFVARRNASTGQ